MYNVHYPYLGLPPAERGVVGRILQHLKDGQLLQLLLVPPLLVQVLVPVRLAGYWTCRVSLPPPPPVALVLFSCMISFSLKLFSTESCRESLLTPLPPWYWGSLPVCSVVEPEPVLFGRSQCEGPAPGSGSTLDKSKTEEILNDILFARSNTD